jgi:hypothetical protein
MEINNHTKFNEFLNNSPRQNIFQIKSNVGAEPLYFLQELYTSPPKINIAWKELETMGLSHPPNKHQLVSSKIPSNTKLCLSALQSASSSVISLSPKNSSRI